MVGRGSSIVDLSTDACLPLAQIPCSSFTTQFVPSNRRFHCEGTDAPVVQMIDKVWTDWQNRNSSNKNAFEGGSISWQASANVSYLLYPTGAPPALNVRYNPRFGRGFCELTGIQQLSSVIPGDGLWENVTIGDVMDPLGGKLCYVYE